MKNQTKKPVSEAESNFFGMARAIQHSVYCDLLRILQSDLELKHKGIDVSVKKKKLAGLAENLKIRNEEIKNQEIDYATRSFQLQRQREIFSGFGEDSNFYGRGAMETKAFGIILILITIMLIFYQVVDRLYFAKDQPMDLNIVIESMTGPLISILVAISGSMCCGFCKKRKKSKSLAKLRKIEKDRNIMKDQSREAKKVIDTYEEKTSKQHSKLAYHVNQLVLLYWGKTYRLRQEIKNDDILNEPITTNALKI